MGSLRWHLSTTVTKSGPTVAQATETGMEQAKAVGERGRHQQKGSGNNLRIRRCKKGKETHCQG